VRARARGKRIVAFIPTRKEGADARASTFRFCVSGPTPARVRERERERTQPAFLGDRSDDEISDGSYDVVISRDSQIHTTLGPGSSDLAFDCVTRLL